MRVFQRVRFNRRVQTHWARRELAICGRKPFIYTGSPRFTSTEILKKPQDRVKPQIFSSETIDMLANEVDPESVVVLEPRPKPTGCRDTCQDGCSEDCSCRRNGLKCSTSYGCRCGSSNCQNLKNPPITMEEYIRRKMEKVETANQKTAEWSELQNSTISSEGSVDDEEKAEFEDDEKMDEGSPDEADVTIANVEDPEDTSRLSPPPSPVLEMDFSPPPPPTDDIPQADSTMKLEDDDDEDSPPPTPSSSSSESSNGDITEPTIDMKPENFSKRMLRVFPGMVDQGEIDSCDPDEQLGSEAIFIGLLRVASAYNKNNDGSVCAVAHPALFIRALEMVESEKAGTKPVGPLDSKLISDNIVYGNGWSDLVIPMLVNRNHWVTAVIRRSLVSITLYDSIGTPISQELSLLAIKKIVDGLTRVDPADSMLSRYKLSYSRSSCREVQTDATSCGLFVVAHVRRALERHTRSAGQRSGDAPIDVLSERWEIQQELIVLRQYFETEADEERVWRHAPGQGQLPIRSARTLVKMRYSGRRC